MQKMCFFEYRKTFHDVQFTMWCDFQLLTFFMVVFWQLQGRVGTMMHWNGYSVRTINPETQVRFQPKIISQPFPISLPLISYYFLLSSLINRIG